MSLNNTACSPSGTCTVLDGAFTNGTYFDAQYDPNYPVPLWRNRLELAFMCIFNSMTRKPGFPQVTIHRTSEIFPTKHVMVDFNELTRLQW
jgi:hypothetical protein